MSAVDQGNSFSQSLRSFSLIVISEENARILFSRLLQGSARVDDACRRRVVALTLAVAPDDLENELALFPAEINPIFAPTLHVLYSTKAAEGEAVPMVTTIPKINMAWAKKKLITTTTHGSRR